MVTTPGIVSSSADSFSGSLDADGFTTTVAPFAQASGAAPPAYDYTKAVAAFDHVYELTPAELNNLSLEVHSTQMVNAAKSAGIGVDSIGAVGTADLGSASFLLTDTFGPSPPAVLGLSVEAKGVHSDSNSSFVFGPNRGSISGDASFRSLTVSGDLVGGKTLTFSGDAKPDTVLYKSSTVTITLDEQTLLLPPAASGVIGPTITTDAVDIHLNHATFAGQTITGDFRIGESSASYALMPPHA
jgi:hypothetical protein